MRKAGGIVALIAGIFSVLAVIFEFALFMFTIVDSISPTEAVLQWIGGIAMSTFVIVMAALLMSTHPVRSVAHHRLIAPGLILICILALVFNWTGGIVALCLLFAILGGILALFQRASLQPQRTT